MKKKALISGVYVQDILSPKLINIDSINSPSWEYEYSLEADLLNAYQRLIDYKNKHKS